MRIDAHQHFWVYNAVRDTWIDESMKDIQRDFLPEDLSPLLSVNNIDGCVVVQTDQTEDETNYLCSLAASYDFIKGVVGWVDLQNSRIEERLESLSQLPKLKGFRHVLQGEPQRDLMLSPRFLHGIKALLKYGFAYDILIYTDQIKYASEMVRQCSNQIFILDHMAKPNIKSGNIEQWRKDMEALARYENVFCKISGMVTEAHWQNWKYEDFVPYLDTIVGAFGVDRVMYGSDWPVCLVAASYKEVLDILTTYFQNFSTNEKAKIFGLNAMKSYGLYLCDK
jgi:L-fuconolactonase